MKLGQLKGRREGCPLSSTLDQMELEQVLGKRPGTPAYHVTFRAVDFDVLQAKLQKSKSKMFKKKEPAAAAAAAELETICT